MGTRLALVGAVLLILSACGTAHPRLTVSGSVTPDIEALALGTWEQFLEFAGDHGACLEDVRLEPTQQLDHRATYTPESGLVRIKIPRSNVGFQESLVHELAHHVERCCPSQVEVRAPLMAAAGIPSDAPWHDGPSWAMTPSERFAEATIEAMLGPRENDAGMVLSRDEVIIVAAWWRGDDPTSVLVNRPVFTSPELLARGTED